MTVIKTRDMDWRKYLQELKRSTFKMSEIEQTEFTGYLLRHDMAEKDNCLEIFKSMMFFDEIHFADLIADLLISESPETINALMQYIKNNVIGFYQETIESLLKSN